MPHETMKSLQDLQDFTSLMILQEELKTMPFGEVWNQFLTQHNVLQMDWQKQIQTYEDEVLSKRRR